jgi:hypothetical protein
MIAAPFILCVSWCTHSPTLGAEIVPPRKVALSVSGGLNVILPMLRLSAVSGVARGFDIGIDYDTYAGLVHTMGLAPRLRVHRHVALRAEVSYGFYTMEEIFGVRLSRAPFGNGLSLNPTLLASYRTRGGVNLAGAVGLSLRFLRIDDQGGVIERTPEISVQHVFAELGAEWQRKHGALFLRFRAVVPVQADFRVIGFLPMFTVGRSFLLP